MIKRFLSVTLVLCLISAVFYGCGKKDDDKTVSSAVVPPVVSQVATPQPEKNAKAVKISADGGLNIRSQPSTDGEILGLAEDGSRLPLLIEKASDGWYEVEYDGKSAYVSADYATVIEVTLEEYNKLKAGDFTAAESEPESSAADSDPVALTTKATPSPTPAQSSQPTADTGTAGGVSNEDGE